ncbi:MAG: hypothetical protein CUN57_03670, partial [Phototrophicales bacterium]
ENDLILFSLEYSRLIDVSMFRDRRLFNIHFSLLPAYRGAYTSIWPILNGEEFSGVTLHEIDHGIDTGRIIYQRRFPIPSTFSARDLYFKYMAAGTELFRDHAIDIIKG